MNRRLTLSTVYDHDTETAPTFMSLRILIHP